ncbi:hypothetical protein [Pseudodesulfovibrio pelocollis]|uniref:hypothetical protein n=1 Tax=Pseudodesulfovibrio pelocollis TaxID=3051432 RepID=UPI00255AD7B9|nr:hypothetical protein [Pseudodesulfovibrio sp. SB368]
MGDAQIAFHGRAFAAFLAMQHGRVPSTGGNPVAILLPLLSGSDSAAGHFRLRWMAKVLALRILAVVDLDSINRDWDARFGNRGKYFTQKDNPLFALAYRGLYNIFGVFVNIYGKRLAARRSFLVV